MKVRKTLVVIIVISLVSSVFPFSSLMRTVQAPGDLLLECSEEWDSGGDTYVNSIAVGDLDGNGEVEVASVGRSTQGSQTQGQLRVWHYDGVGLTVLVDKTFGGVAAAGLQHCKIDDVDSDGDIEIVTLGEVAGGTTMGQLVVWRWDGVSLTQEGSVTWRHQTYDTRCGWTFAISDVEPDGVKEIVTGGGSDTPNIALLKIWNGQTLAPEASTNWITGSMARVHGVTTGDVDEDGQEEIVTTGEAGSFTGVVKGQLRIWNWDGSSLTLEHSHEWQSGGGHTRGYPVLADDIDNDGTTEMVVGGHSITSGGPWSRGRALLWIFTWNGASLTLEKEEWVSGDKWEASMPGICLMDLDHDWIQEICATTQTFESETSTVESAHIKIWSWHSGSLTLETEELWRTTENTRAIGIDAGDPDGDGTYEVITGGSTDGTNSAQLAVWSASMPPPYFIHLTDPHVGSPGAASRFAYVISEINSLTPPPEFVVISGDLVDWGGTASSWTKLFSLLDQLEVTYCLCVGNHDYRYIPLLEDKPWEERPWLFDDYYAQPIGNIHLISMNSGRDDDVYEGYITIPELGEMPVPIIDMTPEAEGLSDDQYIWLTGVIDDFPGLNKILFMHHPVVCTMTEGQFEGEGESNGCIRNNRDELMTLCRNQGVKAVLCGHTHQPYVYRVLSDNSPDLKGEPGDYYSTNEDFLPIYAITDACSEDFGYRKIEVIGDEVRVWKNQHFNDLTLLKYLASLIPLPIPTGEGSIGSDEMNTASPGRLHVYDSHGNHVGINSTGGIDLGIDMAYYESEPFVIEYENETVLYTSNEVISVPLDPTESYTYELEILQNCILDFQGRSIEQNDGDEASALYSNITLYAGSAARLEVSNGNVDNTLYIDDDGDGNYTDRLVQPDGGTGIHNIIVTSVTVSEAIIPQGQCPFVDVITVNHGGYTENFSVTAYCDDVPFGWNDVVNLPSGHGRGLRFYLNTTGIELGNHTITVNATSVPSENNIYDNTYIYGTIFVTILGDINGDRTVGALDLQALNQAYGSTPESPDWNPIADINNDKIVDVQDVRIIGVHWAESW